MQSALIFSIVFLAVMLVFTFPIGFEIFAYSNVLENANFLCVKILGVFYVCRKVSIQNKTLVSTSPNGDVKQLEFKALTPFQNKLIFELIEIIQIDYAFLTFLFGSEEDASKTAYASGLSLAIFSYLKSFLSFKKNVVISYQISTDYKKDRFTLTADFVFNLNILSVIVAVFKSLGVKNGKRKPN